MLQYTPSTVTFKGETRERLETDSDPAQNAHSCATYVNRTTLNSFQPHRLDSHPLGATFPVPIRHRLGTAADIRHKIQPQDPPLPRAPPPIPLSRRPLQPSLSRSADLPNLSAGPLSQTPQLRTEPLSLTRQSRAGPIDTSPSPAPGSSPPVSQTVDTQDTPGTQILRILRILRILTSTYVQP